ncbi:MAG: prepilin-type N-terminal cleavage/methylation domain-containing protein [Myxococcales bacterium]|nr:MAG: prepilin-type N-terminal cleavage/methylation domain-containing protein [Myxococcales bacterium]
MSARFSLRTRRRGFTLVELMVAMSGGLFLSIAVFALSRDATRFYQSEGRMANATLAAVSGFERLASDVARAGHLSTANIQGDPLVCNRPDASFPAELRSLRALVVGTSSATGTEVAAAGISPHSLLVTGALNTPEVFTTMAVAPAAGGSWRVDLDLSTPAADRLNLSLATTAVAANQAILDGIFTIGTNQRGKIVRLRRNGLDQYAVVSAVTAVAGGAFLTLANSPSLLRLERGGPQCGIDDTGKGMALSVIDVVRYDIRSMLSEASYASLFSASGVSGGPSVVPFESGRAELVRVEVDSTGAEQASTREIIGEYAVDLQVSAWGATAANNPALIPVAATAITQTYNSTQLLRGVHLRLGVRSREADRDADVAGSGGGSNNLYRIGLGGSANAPFARVRTLQTDVPLRNLEGNRW